jgi:hypothetical protein
MENKTVLTITFLLADRMQFVTCHSAEHANEIANSLPAALEVRVSPATPAEIEMMEFAGVVPGGTLVERLRIDDYFARLEVECR